MIRTVVQRVAVWGVLIVAACGETEARGSRSELATLSPWPASLPDCPVGDPERARVELEREAHALWDRARFDVGDGPRAVLRVWAALQCAQRAGDLSAVDRLQALHEGWKREVERTFDREALALELALRSGEAAGAQNHASRVSALLHEADDEAGARVGVWLEQVRRRARAARMTAEED